MLDSLDKEIPYPLQAEFRNCIIYGSQSEELGLALSENEAIAKDLLFKNCMLRTKMNLGTLADQCIYPSSPGFLKTGGLLNDYVSDYRLDSLSPARNKADDDFSVSLEFLYDLNGRSRNADEGPDLGAYEF
jgi:hypothetical protein